VRRLEPHTLRVRISAAAEERPGAVCQLRKTNMCRREKAELRQRGQTSIKKISLENNLQFRTGIESSGKNGLWGPRKALDSSYRDSMPVSNGVSSDTVSSGGRDWVFWGHSVAGNSGHSWGHSEKCGCEENRHELSSPI
jgi:hypothetical protein